MKGDVAELNEMGDVMNELSDGIVEDTNFGS